MLKSKGSQRVGQNLASEQQHDEKQQCLDDIST